MQYLTRSEQRRIAAIGNWAPRKLTPVEQLIKKVPDLHAMPHGSQKDSKAKDAAVEEFVQELIKATSTDTLASKVRLAAYGKSALDSLLEGYPYVEFEGLITGTEKLTSIEYLARDGFSIVKLQAMLLWVADLHGLFACLPKGVETFIGTPLTNYEQMRTLAKATGKKAYYGVSLEEGIQKHVNHLFPKDRPSDPKTKARFFTRTYGLLQIPNIWKRALLNEVQEEQLNPGLVIDFVSIKEGWENLQVLRMTEASTNTILNFVIDL